jgi:hypothetical protein
VDGLVDRENERTTPLEWIKLLSRYRDELISCGNCGYEYIVGYAEKRRYTECPSCNASVKEFCTLHVGKSDIALDLGKMLYEPHLDKFSSRYSSAVGRVIANKNNPSLWGIKLALDADVEIKDSAGRTKLVAKDGVIPIIRNLKIKFNDKTIGEIR